MQQWDELAAAPTQYKLLTKEEREHVAQKLQLVPTSRGGHNTTKSSNHPEYGLVSQLKPKCTESPTTPDAHTQQ